MAAAGEWSMWVWVTMMCDTVSPSTARASAATWSASAGPGSITATVPLPTMKLLVPFWVKGVGLFATTRRISGDSALGLVIGEIEILAERDGGGGHGQASVSSSRSSARGGSRAPMAARTAVAISP